MKNIKDPPYRAEGDGIADDTNAIQYALSELRYQEKLIVPYGRYRVKGDGDTIFKRDEPLTIEGEGWESAFLIDSSVPNTRDIFQCASANHLVYGWNFRDFAIKPDIPGRNGRHAFNFIGVNGGAAGFSTIERVLSFQTSGASIKATNNDGPVGQLAYSHIADCNLESMDLCGTGDGLLIDGNTISAETNVAVRARQVIGAGGFNLVHNVITAKHNMAVYFEHGASATIGYNEFETPVNQPNSSGAVILIGNKWDDTAYVRAMQIVGNGISVLKGTNDPIPVMIVKATNTLIEGGRMFIVNPASAHIAKGAGAVGTVIKESTIDCNPAPLRIINV